jgi:carboxypeptidase C (cathepsin A)
MKQNLMKHFSIKIKLLSCTILFLLITADFSNAQIKKLIADTTVVTKDEVTIKGEQIEYTTEAGRGDDGQPIASLFYVYYTRNDVDDRSRRPLLFSFNGGPGSASVWMHIGYTGPRFLKIDDEAHPVQPYGVVENYHSILDVTDIVYIDQVNTGFSRILDEEVERDEFFGVNVDIEYLAEWLENFVSRKGRWTSPKYLIGDSYGTTRVSGLAHELQNSQWMFMNGVILVPPTGLGLEPPAMTPRSEILKLPYYTAAAWFHEALKSDLQSRDLIDLLAEFEEFTIEEYLPAAAYGGALDEIRKGEIAEQVSKYSGISKQDILDHNLILPTSYFGKIF